MEEILEKLERDPESHKGQNGKVAVMAGSRDYTGAPALASKAALRSGCDLTRILTSESVREVVASYSENFIVESYSSDYFDQSVLDKALELADWADAVIIGPGLGNPKPEAVREFIQEAETPLVIDADALGYLDQISVENAVLTPHEAEYQRIGEDKIRELVDNRNVVVKKGSTDRIISSKGEEEIKIGTSSMTVGGTGDVLTGIIASLISQGLEIDEAARLGTWINGKAGEAATDKFGEGMLATDLIESIPDVLLDG